MCNGDKFSESNIQEVLLQLTMVLFLVDPHLYILSLIALVCNPL